jgi:hypothetical protein
VRLAVISLEADIIRLVHHTDYPREVSETHRPSISLLDQR